MRILLDLLDITLDRLQDIVLGIDCFRWRFAQRYPKFIETVFLPTWYWKRCQWHGERGQRVRYLGGLHLCEDCEERFLRLADTMEHPNRWGSEEAAEGSMVSLMWTFRQWRKREGL